MRHSDKFKDRFLFRTVTVLFFYLLTLTKIFYKTKIKTFYKNKNKTKINILQNKKKKKRKEKENKNKNKGINNIFFVLKKRKKIHSGAHLTFFKNNEKHSKTLILWCF